MSEQDEAKFVIVAPRSQGEAVGYLASGGAIVDLPYAQTFSFEGALVRARQLAAELGTESVLVAPLLFGIPDMEQAIQPRPDPA